MSTRPDNIPADSPFAKYYEGEWVPEHHEPRCSEGYHWVKKHTNKNGVTIEGHCARNPFGKWQKIASMKKEREKYHY